MVSPSGLSSSKLKVTRLLLMLCSSLNLLQAQSLRGRLSVLVEAMSPAAVSAALIQGTGNPWFLCCRVSWRR